MIHYTMLLLMVDITILNLIFHFCNFEPKVFTTFFQQNWLPDIMSHFNLPLVCKGSRLKKQNFSPLEAHLYL